MTDTSDKLWAQILFPPIATLVYIGGSFRILSVARAGGELEEARPKLIWYGALVILAVMYASSFHLELAAQWKGWAVVFVLGFIVLAVIRMVRQTGASDVVERWKKIFIWWLVCNAAGVVAVSIFRYFGN